MSAAAWSRTSWRRAALVLALGLAAAQEPPRLLEPPLTDQDRAHWAFRPVGRGAPAAIGPEAIDGVLRARLAERGLEPLPEADRPTLLRRAAFDLTGLPPSPEEIDAFVNDRAPGAYERVVDRLLASPAYGERWAQHWLDLVRFAETDGFEHDKVRPDAWRYRDWVIDALNRDLPYDRFVQLQIAADEIDADHAAATYFLLAGPDMPDLNLQEERRHVVLTEMAGTVGQVFMGLTFGCAECHNHKSDPISQGDFYRLRAVFANTVSPVKDKPLGTVIGEAGPEAKPEHVFVRGDFRRAGAPVEPAFPRILNSGDRALVATPTAKTTGRRRALAEWLAREEHPTFRRVIVNWLWAHHFGRGIVATPGDFGKLGATPSNPEILDLLAAGLPRAGWSLKAMHRVLVTTAAYRRASLPSGPEDGRWRLGKRIDPENALLWRANRRRLEGEAIRDAMLAVSGMLSPRRGGPGVRPPLPPEVTSTLLKDQWQVSPDAEDHRRRSVYLFARRNLRFPLFEVFDRPSANASCPQRTRSTTAPQSLMLLNAGFSQESARALAARVSAGAEGTEARVDLACLLALGRRPDAAERRRAAEFLAGGELADFALALLNLNEFAYVD